MSRTALFVLAGLVAVLPRGVSAQDWRTITSMRQLGGEDELRVTVEYGAGHLEVAPAAKGVLYRSSLRYDAEVIRPDISYRSGRLRLGLDNVRVRGRNMKSGQLQLDLGTELPLDLRLEFGAARANLDLSGLQLKRLRIATGASETDLRVDSPSPESCDEVDLDVGAAAFRAIGLGNLNPEKVRFSGGVGEVVLDFTGESRRDIDVGIEMGLGSLTLRVPRGTGIQVHKSGLLVGFDGQELIKRGDTFYSEDWESADRKITFAVQAALGSIRVVWVDAGGGDLR